MAYDYFYNTFGRNSVDGNGAEIKIHTNRGGLFFDPVNATWDNDNNTGNFGKGDGIIANDLVSIDIVGHEITHGVTFNSAELEYQYESGALNESFSDIFGTMIEYYGEYVVGYTPLPGQSPHPIDYDMGEDAWISGALRSLSNPKLYNQPNTYLGDNWWTAPGDNGGVHTNSGVQNFWFYLLSEGAAGFVDDDPANPAYNVIGIGRNKAAKIAYRNLTTKLTSSSGYFDARRGAIIAAKELYGSCSNEVIQTANAWFAVGVGSQSPAFDRHACGDFVGIANRSAINLLTAGTSVPDNCAYTTIHNGSTITFSSANEIVLLPGFTAEAGSNFTAFIDPCAVASFKTSNTYNAQTYNYDYSQPDVNIENSSANQLTNYPNPFNASIIFEYSLIDEENNITLTIHNIFGEEVSKLINNQPQEKGTYKIEFNTSDLLKGIYFYTLQTNNNKITRKMMKVE